jgi:hypothetical protein
VVGHQHVAATTAGDLEQAEVVDVVAELLGLGLHGLLVDVEVRSTRFDRVTPADEDVVVVADRDRDVVALVGWHRLEGQLFHGPPLPGGGGRGGRVEPAEHHRR